MPDLHGCEVGDWLHTSIQLDLMKLATEHPELFNRLDVYQHCSGPLSSILLPGVPWGEVERRFPEGAVERVYGWRPITRGATIHRLSATLPLRAQEPCPECDGKAGWFVATDDLQRAWVPCGHCSGGTIEADSIYRRLLVTVCQGHKALIEWTVQPWYDEGAEWSYEPGVPESILAASADTARTEYKRRYPDMTGIVDLETTPPKLDLSTLPDIPAVSFARELGVGVRE